MLAVALFGGCVALFPSLPIDPRASPASALTAYALSYALVATCVLATAALTPDLGRAALVVAALAGAVLVGLASAAPTPLDAAAVLTCLLVLGTSAGAAVGARIESAGHLLPVAIVSSLADVVSVLTPGAPSEVVADTPALLSILAISWPMAGTTDITALLGVGDVVVIALYLASARRHALSLRKTLLALALGLFVTALVVAATSLAIPALPFLGGAMVLAHPEARRLPPRDRRPALLGLVVIALALGALVLSRGAR